MSGHFIIRCSCNAIVSQCRCPGPKAESVVPQSCVDCRSVQPPEPYAGPWPPERVRLARVDNREQW